MMKQVEEIKKSYETRLEDFESLLQESNKKIEELQKSGI